MSTTALDTSVIAAASLTWHEAQAPSARLLTLDRRDFERLDLAGIELVVPAASPQR